MNAVKKYPTMKIACNIHGVDHIKMRELFRYRAGKLYFKLTRAGARAGDLAGGYNYKWGKITISLKSGASSKVKSPVTSRAKVVWLMHNGWVPITGGFVIHHKDGDLQNDRIGNLEVMTRAESMALNRGMQAKQARRQMKIVS